jgi:hypothetical protein
MVAAVAAGLLVGMVVVNAPEQTAQAAPAPAPAAQVDASAPATPFTGGATGCVVDDPTSKGCLTGVTAHGLDEIARVFGGYRKGPVIRSAACWDEHAWNPSSDHSRGKGCDIYTSPAGEFASGKGLDDGNTLAAWLRANEGVLDVSYVIWQGRIWSREKGDRKYTGGGIYNPNDPVGGHYDHLHVSFRR